MDAEGDEGNLLTKIPKEKGTWGDGKFKRELILFLIPAIIKPHVEGWIFYLFSFLVTCGTFSHGVAKMTGCLREWRTGTPLVFGSFSGRVGVGGTEIR